MKPGDSVDKPTAAYEYALNFDAGEGIRLNWVEARQRERAGGDSLDSRTFFDGLGRKIMTRSEGESLDRVVVTDTVQLNARQFVRQEYLPYFESGTPGLQGAVARGRVH